MGASTIDLEYQGTSQLIACYVLDSSEGVTVVDPGPSSSVDRLLESLKVHGFQTNDINSILVTHVHLDHAGAVGRLIQLNRRIRVFVHEKGAKHLVDPTSLMRSAARLFGDDLDRLWGPMLPVPAQNVHTLSADLRMTVAGRKFEVLYTPGHAQHHVTYLDTTDGTAFVGDVGGVEPGTSSCILPVTPPPDIDLASWGNSTEKIASRRPTRLALAHFGFRRFEGHFEQLCCKLKDWSEAVRRSLKTDETDSLNARTFREEVLSGLRDYIPEREIALYEWAADPEASWYGLARYWRRRE